MKPSARLYHCSRCHCQVVICRHCDRGQVYCGAGCAEAARSDSRRRAARKYQSSRRGRFTNAARQRRYRQRQREKVTHQGSTGQGLRAVLAQALSARVRVPPAIALAPTPPVQCHFCQRECDPFLRQRFLSVAARSRRPVSSLLDH